MMLGRKNGLIGIELGTHALKLAQLERAGGKVRIAASAVLRRRETLQGGPRWSGDEISAALALHPGFSGRRVACVLPMQLADLSALDVPPGKYSDRWAIVSYELSSMFPGEQRPRQFDFWETDPGVATHTATAQNVNVLSVSEDLVARLIGCLSEAGLTCEVMDGLPFALARATSLAYPGRRAVPRGAVEWGFTSGTFCVVLDGRPHFTRHLRNCGLSSTVDAVSRALGLSETEAMQLLAEYGLPGQGGGDGRCREIQTVLAEVTAHSFGEMVDELNKTLSYVEMQYPAMLPEELCLFGDGAGVKNVASLLSEKVGRPVSPWRLHGYTINGCDTRQNSQERLGVAAALSALAWNS